MNIRQKLILLLLSIALLPTLTVSTIAYIIASNDIASTRTSQLQSIASQRFEKLSALLRSKNEQIQAFAFNLDFQRAVRDYLNSSRDDDSQVISQIDAIADDSVKDVWVTDTNGRLLTSTFKTNVPDSLPLVEAGAGASAGVRGLTLSVDPRDNLNYLFVTERLSLSSQDVVFISLQYELTDFSALLQDYSGLGETGEVVVSETRDERAISLFPLRFDRAGALATDLTSLELTEQLDTVYENVIDYRGEPVIAITKYIAQIDWSMATKIDRAEALSSTNVLRNSIIAITVITTVGIFFLALWLASRFTRPIAELTATARKIMFGDLYQRIKVSSKDEVGALGDTFNRMADRLAASYRGLEMKVAQRTSDLNQKVQELGEAAAKDEAILGSIGDGLIVTDSNGNILLVNAIAIELLNLPTTAVGSQIANYPVYDEKGEQITPRHTPVQVVLEAGKKVIQDVQSIKPDGSKRALSITASPASLNGRVIGVIQLVRDVTREREVDRMKTEFISLSSHQLRTPLSAIKWFGEMLVSGDAGKLTTEQQEFATNIYKSTERMIELVDSLLNISRIESGRIIVDPKPTNMSELVQGVVNDLKQKAADKRQTLVVSVHKDLPMINLDPHLIGQVYLNLLSNAIKYTPDGGEIQLYVSSKGDQLLSQVSDNGYGIPKEQQAKVFQRFFRAENIVKVVTDGTGLGLYLVKAIVESSGGKIWFESADQKGTTFWFTLPMSGMKAKKGEVTLNERTGTGYGT